MSIVDAARNGNWELVREQVRCGNVNKLGEFRDTALHHAVRRNDSEMVRYLIQNGANPYLKDVYSRNSIDFIGFEDVDVARALLESGAEPVGDIVSMWCDPIMRIFKRYGLGTCETRKQALAALETKIEEPAIIAIVGDFVQLTNSRRPIHFPELERMRAQELEITRALDELEWPTMPRT
jgi:hypothetical protein